MKNHEIENIARCLSGISGLTLPLDTFVTFYIRHKENCPVNSGSSECQCSFDMVHAPPDGRMQVLPGENLHSPSLAFQGVISPEEDTSPGVKTRPGIAREEFLGAVARLPEADRAQALSEYGPHFAP
jgi:hypothetical protein